MGHTIHPVAKQLTLNALIIWFFDISNLMVIYLVIITYKPLLKNICLINFSTQSSLNNIFSFFVKAPFTVFPSVFFYDVPTRMFVVLHSNGNHPVLGYFCDSSCFYKQPLWSLKYKSFFPNIRF